MGYKFNSQSNTIVITISLSLSLLTQHHPNAPPTPEKKEAKK